MKRIIFLFTALLLSLTQTMAQKYFDVYQNGKVAKSIPTADIDSVNLTGNNDQTRKVNFWRSGKVVESYGVNEVDSIKVFRPNDEQLVYLGIVGFNQELYDKHIDVLASSTSSLYKTYVGNLARKDGTLLYYAVDHALDLLAKEDFATPLSSVNLITFTDGLDQGSLMMNGNYSTNEQYLNAVQRRIANTKVKGLPIMAYSVGLRGNDVSDYNQFQTNLERLASSSDKAFEVSSMYDVNTRLKEISDRIISISNRQTVSVKIPGQGTGTLIRFTFDGNTPESSTMYIEGTFNLADRSLRNVTYHGIKALGNNYVQGTQDGIFVTFTFSELQREDENGLIPMNSMSQYVRAVGSTTWQRNSEFTPNNNTLTTVTHSGAAIVLVLDCSSSLGYEFGNLQSYAKNFIDQLANNTAPFSVDAPTNVTAILDEDNYNIKVTWDAVKHAEKYEVYRSSSSGGTYQLVAENIISTNWTDESPLEGNNYYRLYAIGHGLKSSASQTSVERPMHPAEPIDLGLPSGTKWASYNVGATKPEEYGGYYAWGETEEKDVYNTSTYKYYQNGSYVSLGSDISGTEYDVAHVKWGGDWRMPNRNDIKELYDNCTSEWTTLNGVNGRKITSNINGNSIFLPAAGYRWDSGLYNAGDYGSYWSSTLYGNYPSRAYGLDFYSGDAFWIHDSRRYYGRSVRPVR